MKVKNLVLVFAFACASGYSVYSNHKFEKTHKKLEEAAFDWLQHSRESAQPNKESGELMKKINHLRQKRNRHLRRRNAAGILCALMVLGLSPVGSSRKNEPLDLEL